jgi:hypothetical protein
MRVLLFPWSDLALVINEGVAGLRRRHNTVTDHLEHVDGLQLAVVSQVVYGDVREEQDALAEDGVRLGGEEGVL